MCGFVGFYDKQSIAESKAKYSLQTMATTLAHRGPDSSGEWYDKKSGVGLAHRRLAIQDLSPQGHQPMQSNSGRYVLVYNGEIYNFLEIKNELLAQDWSFRGHSDTEVMLAAFEVWGIKKALERFTGMFAFAVWDSVDRILFLIRDRMGEKPLYYGWQGNTFMFASELKALRKHPDWENDINRDALTLLLRHNYIPAPHTIFQKIHKLFPGSILAFNTTTNNFTVEQYWSLTNEYNKAINNQLKDTPGDIADILEDKLLHTIKRQMIADVPVGAFLSGGIDSSTIVALMQSLGTSRVKTFTIGFNDEDHNEAQFAKTISKRLKTEHTELYVSPEQTLDVIPKLASIYDEPFADSSQIPTYLVSRMTREKVTVSLSGDGGDELFCGYPHYFQTLRIWNRLQQYPEWTRKMLAGFINKIPQHFLDPVTGFLIKNFSDRNHHEAGRKIHELSQRWSKSSLREVYQHHLSYWKDSSVVLDASEPDYVLNDPGMRLDKGNELQNLQYWDMSCYLPDDILTKVDRAAMASSLETRVPFLDHKIVEFALRIPTGINTAHKNGKWPLRHILEKYVPIELFDRPKKGFAVPVGDWLKGPLNEWGSSLLERKLLDREGYFDTDKVQKKWEAHLQNERDHAFSLWGILMFQSWLQSWQDNK